jgi:hypothetical protein
MLLVAMVAGIVLASKKMDKSLSETYIDEEAYADAELKEQK